MALKLDIAPEARLIFADKRAIKQILVNLLTNGVKFTPRGGEVPVSARGGHGIEIPVRDTGTGIAKADLERLGRPFEQVENAAVRAKEGTGLGLALVKSLAGMHGGEAVLEFGAGRRHHGDRAPALCGGERASGERRSAIARPRSLPGSVPPERARCWP